MYHYPFHVSDYAVSTAHLTPIEDLAYRRLLDLYYITERPIPLETQWVARRIRVDTEVVESVLLEFFERLDDGYHNQRCDAELVKYQQVCDRNKHNGKQGGRPKKTQSVSTGLPLETQTKANQEPRTKNQSKPFVPSEFIEQFWPIYPKKEGKAEAVKAFVKANINGNLPAVLTALKRQIVVKGWDKDKTYCPLASTWLNGKRWEDELEQAEQYRGNEV